MLLGNGGELQKVAADLKQMMDEETKLREENLKLKVYTAGPATKRILYYECALW